MDKKSVNSSTRGVWSASGAEGKGTSQPDRAKLKLQRVIYSCTASLIHQALLLVLNQRGLSHSGSVRGLWQCSWNRERHRLQHGGCTSRSKTQLFSGRCCYIYKKCWSNLQFGILNKHTRAHSTALSYSLKLYTFLLCFIFCIWQKRGNRIFLQWTSIFLQLGTNRDPHEKTWGHVLLSLYSTRKIKTSNDCKQLLQPF